VDATPWCRECAGDDAIAASAFRRKKSNTQKGHKTMTGSLHVGLAALGAAIGVGLIGQGASIAVGRNPGASTKIMVQSILAIAFAEAIVFYALFLVR
jgi:F-type H+-transporting ATPase subunit c